MTPELRRAHRAPGWQQGFGDGLAQAVSLVVTPLLFGFAGVLLDRWLGTGPLFAVVLGALGVVGTFLSTYYQYQARMEAADEGKPWARNRP